MKTIQKFLLGAAVTATCALAAPKAEATQVGPDLWGTIATDAAHPSLYGYVDITTTGTQIITNGDDNAATVNFPAGSTFSFYGAERTSLRVSANGYLSTDLTDTGDDWDNDCPATVVGSGARLYALHDDFESVNVFYEHFPTENVSVIQWVGAHWNGTGGTGSVNFEVLIYHNLHVAVVQVAADTEAGAGSTMGAFSSDDVTGITLGCNSSGYVTPGSMFVPFGTLRINELRADQPGADTDEWFELSGVPGFVLDDVSLVVIGDGAAAAGSGVIEDVLDLTSLEFDPGGLGNVLVSVGDLGSTLPGLDYNVTAGNELNFENDDTVTYAIVDGNTGTVGQDLDTNDDGLLDVLPWLFDIDAMSIVKDDSIPPTTSEWWYAINTVGPRPGGGVPWHVERCPDIVGAWSIGGDELTSDTPTGLNLCAQCGNGLVEGVEECDGDGAGDGGETATCNDDCTLSACGDGKVNTTAGEGCDDGDLDNEDDCPDDGANGGTCQPATCGDGHIDMEGAQTEVCDDGNGSNDDDCPDGVGGTCEPATCGDGHTNSTGTNQEDCDDAGESATCNDDCTTATCGDMKVNNTAGETCDDGARTATCDSDCTAVTCGDGIVNATSGEVCDGDGAGNGGETATCDTDCTAAECGDGVVNAAAGETCDDTAESLDCDDDCTAVVCGDGNVNTTAGEECDDGNTANGDGCDATCQSEGVGGAGGGGPGPGGAGGAGPGVGGGGPGVGGGGPSGSGGSSANDDDGTEAEGGCDCSAPGGEAPTGAAPLALLLGLGAMMRRRRRAA